MGKIVCILGKSCSGKDTLYNMLLADTELALRPFVLYTTRPIRAEEEDGREYHFVTEARMTELEQTHEVIERRVYYTACGPWSYCTLNDKQTEEESLICVTVLSALDSYFKTYGKDNIMIAYIQADDGIRLKRAIEREAKQQSPSYTEVCRRFLADEEDYSEEKLDCFSISKRYNNEDLNVCFHALKRDIIDFLD